MNADFIINKKTFEHLKKSCAMIYRDMDMSQSAQEIATTTLLYSILGAVGKNAKTLNLYDLHDHILQHYQHDITESAIASTL